MEIVVATKVCRKCKEEKPLTCFSPDKGGKFGVHGYCKRCKSKEMSALRQKNLEEARKYDRQIYYKHHEKAMAWRHSDEGFGRHLLRRYGITLEEYRKLSDEQGGRCAICGTDTPHNGRTPLHSRHQRLHVDHDHQTKKVRGLLCHSCNISLGLLKENIDTLRNAIEYLTHHAKEKH